MTRPMPQPVPRALKSLSRLGCLMLAMVSCTTLAGCTDPTGPVFGDWYGFNPLPTPQGNISIELVLDGAPTATSGRYRLHRQSFWAEDMMFNRADTLDGTWTLREYTVDGKIWRNVFLKGPELHITHYVLLPNGYLTPATDQNTPDMGEGGWKCCRLAPRARNSFGYGRV
ncbi:MULTISPECIES: hypothetical protein [Asaia]|nr:MULTISPECIES: hypothetical protein [Asaia]MDL2171324.1 hypothetical protein [Asaia sp. HumB]